ncbi:uncharacterized protein LOC128174616 [Crassostrea angulata]|uniref:uncharacterized protein LOC128174616 n=1 Tax=Magallana angulata TaxID=2784310 RepID=UPI0022B203CC|nr:uncharacterized protein LOC128174616 [Crassostrea angulata]
MRTRDGGNYDEETEDTQDNWILDEILSAKTRRTENTPGSANPDIFDFTIEEESEIPPVIIGKALPAVAVPGPCLYKEGDFVCTDVPEYAGEWPQVCRVIAAEENHLVVHWYKGSKSTTWTPCTRRMKGQKGRTEPWIERVAREYVWSTPFRLTSAGHIPKKMKDRLDEYSF